MAETPTLSDARKSLTDHVEAKGAELHANHGRITWKVLQEILADRSVVRYPCAVVFDPAPLQSGEFAYARCNGATPEEGYTIFVHPIFLTQPEALPCLVLYHLVVVNYGDFAGAEDAEAFGAAALGISREEYYQALCRYADQLTA